MKTKTAVRNGNSNAENSYVRFDERKVASAKPRRWLRFWWAVGCSLLPLLASAEIKESYSSVNIGSNTTLTLPLSIEMTKEFSSSGMTMVYKTTLKGVIANISVPSGKSAHLQVEGGDFTISSGSFSSLKYVVLVNGIDKKMISERGKYSWDLSSDSTVKLYITGTGYSGAATGPCKITVTYSGSGTSSKVMVSFNANGGSVSPSQKEYTVGDAYGSLPTPTRSGYRFVRWTTSAGSGVTTSSLASASVTTLIAQWEKIESDPDPQTVSVTFYLNDPSGLVNKSTSKTYTVGRTYGTFPSFTLSGYTFQGWYTSGGTRYYESSTVSASVTKLYAHWKENVSVKPDLKSYTPSGWSGPLVASTSSVSTTDSSKFSSDDAIYVSWAVICRNGSSGAFRVTLEVDDVHEKRWRCSGLNDGGYTYYCSYSIGKLSSGTHVIKIIIDSESEVAESNEGNNVISKTFTVVGGEDPKPQTLSVSLPAAGGTASTDASFSSGGTYVFTGSGRPSWITDIDVTVNSGGDTINIGSGTSTIALSSGATATLAFAASANTTGASRSWDYVISGPVKTTVTVKQPPQPVAARPYSIRFIRNDGAGAMETRSFASDVSEMLPTVAALGFARRGYDFGGWALTTADARAGAVWEWDGAWVRNAASPGQRLDVYAIWTLKSDYYQIRFEKNDGTGKWRALGYEYGKSTLLPTCANGLGWTRAGYEFKGWSTSPTSGALWRSDKASVTAEAWPGETRTFYAIWKKVSAWAVATAMTAKGVVAAETSAGAFESTYCRGLFADGSGMFDLLLGADGTAFFHAETEAGVWATECEAEVVGDALVLTMEDAETLVIRLKAGTWIVE